MTTETAKNFSELAAELLTVLSRIEPQLDAAVRADWQHTSTEHWYHDDTTQILRTQGKAWLKVEADVWRLIKSTIALGHAHGVRVLDDVPHDVQEHVCETLGIRPGGGG